MKKKEYFAVPFVVSVYRYQFAYMHIRRLLVWAAFIFLSFRGISQDIRFSQFYASPLHLNPAFAGAAEKTRFISNFRSQWSSLPGSFVTTSASLDDYASKYRSGGGVLMTYDQVSPGKLSSAEMALLYSYKINIGDEWELKTGLQAGYVNRKLNYYAYTYEDQLDVLNGIGSTAENFGNADAVNYLDFSSGFLFFNQGMWFGASAYHLNRPNQTLVGDESRLPIKYSLIGGKKITLNEKRLSLRESKYVTLTPCFSYHAQGAYRLIDMGLYLDYYELMAGLHYRGFPKTQDRSSFSSEALVPMIGFSVSGFIFGYSYDINLTRLGPRTGSAHEFTLAYDFEIFYNPKKKKRGFALPCPKI